MNNVSIKTVAGVYGKARKVINYKGLTNLYVHKTSMKTWIVTEGQCLDLESMLEINGEYHFGTLKELKAALNA